MRQGPMGDIHRHPPMSRKVALLFVVLAGTGAYFIGPMIPVNSATPKMRMSCGDGFVLVGGMYQRPQWVCVAGHMPKMVPVDEPK